MNKKSSTIVLIVLLLVVIAGGAYYMLVLKQQVSKAPPEPQQYTYELGDAFITNVKNSRKLLKTSVVLVSGASDLQGTLDEKKYVIRDTVLFILRDLTEEDISSETIQDKLRGELPDALNKALGISSIDSVYFGDFVMQ